VGRGRTTLCKPAGAGIRGASWHQVDLLEVLEVRRRGGGPTTPLGSEGSCPPGRGSWPQSALRQLGRLATGLSSQAAESRSKSRLPDRSVAGVFRSHGLGEPQIPLGGTRRIRPTCVMKRRRACRRHRIHREVQRAHIQTEALACPAVVGRIDAVGHLLVKWGDRTLVAGSE